MKIKILGMSKNEQDHMEDLLLCLGYKKCSRKEIGDLMGENHLRGDELIWWKPDGELEGGLINYSFCGYAKNKDVVPSIASDIIKDVNVCLFQHILRKVEGNHVPFTE